MNRRTSRLEPVPDYAGRVLDARVHLLDRQILDPDEDPVTTVDDLEITDIAVGRDVDRDAPPAIEALLAGGVLATRLFGGRPPASRLERIDADLVTEVGVVIRISAASDDLTVTWPERWLRDRVIARIPGGRHDPE